MSKKLTKEEFVKKAKNVHGDKYDYSKVEYVNVNTKICIICPIHGEFWQIPSNHFQGKGCPKCGCGIISEKLSNNTEKFIENARKIHGDKYDYSKVEYKNAKTKICVICPKHGEFLQEANSHIMGHGCQKCKTEENAKRQKMSTEQFTKKAKKIHGDKYDYSKVKYKKYDEKVCIVCPKHGEFWQIPSYHLTNCGCPVCKDSKLEKEVREYLNDNKIVFESFKKFDWLGKQHLDFYLPKYNIAIECQGEQHFEVVKHFGGEDKYEIQQKRDFLKNKLCKENGIKLLYYTNYKKIEEDNITIFKNKENLINAII